MQFKEYISLLSESPLKREDFDKLLLYKGIKRSLWQLDKYSMAVIDGFRGNEEFFMKENPEKYIEKEVEPKIDPKDIRDIKEKIDKGNKEILDTTKNMVNSSIESLSIKSKNYIDESITKQWDKVKKEIDKVKEFINVTGETIQDVKEDISEQKKEFKENLNTKSEKDHTHSEFKEYDKKISDIDKKVDEKTDFKEVKKALDEFYTKSEVDKKISSIKKVNNISVSGWIPQWGSWWSSWSKLLTLIWQSFTVTYNGSNQVVTQTYADGTVTTNTYTGWVVTQTVTIFADETITADYIYTGWLVTSVTFS